MQPSFERLIEHSTDGYFRHHFDEGLVYVSPGFATLTGRPFERLTSERPEMHELLHQESHREFKALLDQIIEERSDARSALLQLQRPDGTVIWVEMLLVAAFDNEGELIGVDGVARDVSEHFAVADLLSRRSLEQSALLDAQRVLLTTLDLDRSIERIVEQAQELLEAHHSALFLLDPETRGLHRRGDDPEGDTQTWQQAQPLIHWAIGEERAVRVDPVERQKVPDEHLAALPAGASLLASPLRVGKKTVGALAVIGEASQYSDDDVAFLEALSQVAALALTNSRTFQAMEQLASVDGLTGAYNRRFFEANLSPEVDRAHRLGYPLSMLMIDIDDLKQINDRQGHVAGDQALKHVVALVRRRIRETDWIARYGGDEFAVILPGCSSAHLERLGQELLTELRERDVEGVEGSVRALSSIGAACADEPGFSGSELIEAADLAERSAKSAGGNRMILQQLILSDGGRGAGSGSN